MSISRSKSFHMLASVTFCLLLLVLMLQSSCQGQRETGSGGTPRVIGGVDAPRKRFPYMCSLRRHGAREHRCGGTLIKSQWVLTAAHCIDPMLNGSTGLSPIVNCGIYERNERNSSKAFAADRSYLHPKWKGDIMEGYDIALIKLDKPCESPLPNLDTFGNVHKPGDVFAALGWGITLIGHLAEVLQIASHLSFVDTGICNHKTYWDGQIKNSMICAGTRSQDTARGDSGGPLLVLDYLNGDYTLGDAHYDLLVGITSFGEDSRDTFKPGVYTSVSYFKDWIDCITEEKENCSNDGQRTTESAVAVDESKPTSSNTTQIKEDSQPSSTSEASSIPQSSIEPLESLAEGFEEDPQRHEDLSDRCLDVTSPRNFDLALALERARAALHEDDSNILEETLCEGLSPNAVIPVSNHGSNWSLLHEAARYDAIESARVLIDFGADIERRTNRHYHPLHISAEYKSVRVAQLLIKFGANIESSTVDRWRPLHFAAYFDYLLIDSGADVESRSSLGDTPLHLSASRNALAATKILVRRGAEIESRDDSSRTPLHRAARWNAPEVAEYLIDTGANISVKGFLGNTPLHEAALGGSLEVVEVLVDSSADVNVKNDAGRMPLHFASRYNNFDVAKFLINNGASKTEKDNNGNTPYNVICERTEDECSAEEVARLQRLLRIKKR